MGLKSYIQSRTSSGAGISESPGGAVPAGGSAVVEKDPQMTLKCVPH